MLVPGSALPMLLAYNTGVKNITNGIRLYSAYGNYFYRQFSSGNQKKWTLSIFLKRSILGGERTILSAPNYRLCFTSDYLRLYQVDTGAVIFQVGDLWRDIALWHHLCLGVDTTQAQAANRVKVQLDNIDKSVTVNNIGLNSDLGLNSAVEHRFGMAYEGNYAFDGYMASIHWVDGYKKSASDFAEFNSVTSKWQPKTYRKEYGTNGFNLPFSSGNYGTTQGRQLFDDYSSRGNNFIGVNFYRDGSFRDCWLTDNPNKNYPVLDTTQEPAYGEQYLSKVNGGLDFSAAASSAWATYSQGTALAFISGKQYLEVLVRKAVNSYPWVALEDPRTQTVLCEIPITTVTDGVYGIAIDFDNGKIWVRQNKQDWDSGDPAQGTDPSIVFTPVSTGLLVVPRCYAEAQGSLNFGQRAFSFAAPYGYGVANMGAIPSMAFFPLTFVVTANTQNLNLREIAIGQGWDQIVPLRANIIVSSGVVVGTSTVVSTYGTSYNQYKRTSRGAEASFVVPDLPATSIVNLENNGYIVGAGGAGGHGNPIIYGEDGGAAIKTSYPINVTNNGVIGGGGGGGAGYYSAADHIMGGGGGAGNNPGPGGIYGYHGTIYWLPDGTLTSGGNGGNTGNGGNLGMPGNPALGRMTYGAAGPAVIGNSYVTWQKTGTIYGSLI